jgi:hypothetical protein
MAAKFLEARAPAAEAVIEVSGGDTVTVNLTQNKQLYFQRLLGRGTIPVTVSAVAVINEAAPPCMLALGADEPIGIDLVGAAKVDAPKCLVQSNSTHPKSINTQGAPSLVASKVCAAVQVSRAKTSPPPQVCAPAPDPYRGRTLSPFKSGAASSTYSGPCDFVDKNFGVSGKGAAPAALTPGVYCGGLSVQSTDVELSPGLYIMQDGPLSLQGNATLKGNGVSILLSGTGAVLDLQGSPSLTLNAMQNGPMADIAIASITPATPILTSTLQGSPKLTVNGSVYLPNERLQLQGHPELDMLGRNASLIALSFHLQGSPQLTISSDSTARQNWSQGPRLSQ